MDGKVTLGGSKKTRFGVFDKDSLSWKFLNFCESKLSSEIL
jgi:hypothetical protein